MIQLAVIPAAGLGTRMLPAAKAVPKELLPIVDRPVIQYVVEEATAAGAREIVIITSPHKPAIRDHFDPDSHLCRRLRQAGKAHLIGSIDRLLASVRITFVEQPAPRGLGDALLCAESAVAHASFLCLLGDTIFSGNALPATELASVHASLNTPLIGLERIDPSLSDRYGIATGQPVRENLIRIDSLVEKPKPSPAAGNLAIAARYVLPFEIFDSLHRTASGHNSELQLTDAIAALLPAQPLHGVVLNAHRHDIGDPQGWLATNIAFASRDEKLWRHLSAIAPPHN